MEENTLRNLFTEALRLHQEGNWLQALVLYRELLSNDAHHVASLNALYNIASIYASQNNFSEAINLLKELLSFDSEHARAHAQLARLLYNQGQFSESIDHFRLALLDSSLNFEREAELHHDLGISLLAANQHTEAITELNICLKLNEGHSEAHYHLATAYLKSNELAKALNHYFQQLSIQPMLDAYYNIGVILTTQNRNQEAIPYFEEVLQLDSNYLNAHLNLAVIHLKFGRQDQAIYHYEAALKLKPEDAEISYILAGLNQSKEIPEAAPSDYLSHLFDQYALYYDKHLKEHLQYQVPEQILSCLKNYTELDQSKLNILDLGCGTGLAGVLLRPFSKKLVGVDISDNMLDLAEQKHVYTELVHADITEYLMSAKDFDLIIAADVFSYHGKLERLFAESYRALNAKAYFIFSVERGFEYPYHLHTSLRYNHTKQYLEEIIQQFHFITVSFENLILRHQQNESVEGYLILLQKP